MAITNIPVTTSDSSTDVKQFFDKFFVNEVTFPANEVDAVVGFFVKNGFDVESSRNTAIVLLNQAKVDNVKVFKLIDTLKVLSDVQLSQVVAQILNTYREKTSLLGYRIAPLVNQFESRNILV